MNYIALIIFILSFHSIAFGNDVNESFSKAKLILNDIYSDHRVTVYCAFNYNEKGEIIIPKDFTIDKYKNRSLKIEWEHIVPAENFGRNFKEWRDGDPQCVDGRGKKFKGRKCAEKVNKKFRLMQADMYNLHPEMGAINALRSNYNFEILDSIEPLNSFCEIKIGKNKVDPPSRSRGVIARTYKYMDYTYPNYKMSNKQRKLMNAWDTMYPVDEWECKRAYRIEKIQGNSNKFVKDKCIEIK